MKRWPKLSAERDKNWHMMWVAICFMLLWLVSAPHWAGYALIALQLVCWASGVYADYLEEKLTREFPRWREYWSKKEIRK